MVEKRIVTKNRDGEVVKIIEYHDLLADKKRHAAFIRAAFFIGSLVGGLLVAAVFPYVLRF